MSLLSWRACLMSSRSLSSMCFLTSASMCTSKSSRKRSYKLLLGDALILRTRVVALHLVAKARARRRKASEFRSTSCDSCALSDPALQRLWTALDRFLPAVATPAWRLFISSISGCMILFKSSSPHLPSSVRCAINVSLFSLSSPRNFWMMAAHTVSTFLLNVLTGYKMWSLSNPLYYKYIHAAACSFTCLS